jgi:hypothetical protein
MAGKRGEPILSALPGALFVLAGLRDFFAPGLLCISSRPDTDGTPELLVGVAFLALTAWRWTRARRAESAAAQR